MINCRTFHSLRSSAGLQGRNVLRGWKKSSSLLKGCDRGGVAWQEEELTFACVGVDLYPACNSG